MSVLPGLGLSAYAADPGMGATNTPSTSFGGGSGSSSSSSSSQPGVIPQMQQNYQNLLALNQQNYSGMLGAYNQGQSNINQQMPGITAGYGALNQGVQNTLGLGGALGGSNWGVAQPAATAIGQAYQQNLAQNTQNMANAGLGNTTVGANQANQATLGAAQAYGGLGAQLAQTSAGYQAQLGQAGLASQMQGLGLQTGLSQAQGGAMAGYQFQNTAGNLVGQYAQSQSNSQQQQQQQSQGGQGVNPNANPVTSNNGAPSPFSPGGGGYPATSPYQGGGGTAGGGGGIGGNSPNFSYGANAGQGAANYPTTGFSGSAGVLGGGYPPGGAPQSITQAAGNGPGGPTTGFSGQVMGNQAPNAMSANPYAQPSSGTQDYQQQAQQIPGFSEASPEDQQKMLGYLQQGLQPTYAVVGNANTPTLIGWH